MAATTEGRADYVYGETVTICATGKVSVFDGHGLIVELAQGGRVNVAFGPDVTVDRQVPADGEPQPGDLWTDVHGQRWFAIEDWHEDQPPRVRLCGESPYGMGANEDPVKVNQRCGPLTLVYRPEPTSGGV